jgi:hypothetical protein
LLKIVSFYAFSGCCRRTHKLFELGKFHHPPTIAKTSVDMQERPASVAAAKSSSITEATARDG